MLELESPEEGLLNALSMLVYENPGLGKMELVDKFRDQAKISRNQATDLLRLAEEKHLVIPVREAKNNRVSYQPNTEEFDFQEEAVEQEELAEVDNSEAVSEEENQDVEEDCVEPTLVEEDESVEEETTQSEDLS